MDHHKLARAASAFKRQHARGAFPGGQLVVFHRGHLVLNESVGLARGYRDTDGEVMQAVTPTTAFPAYSCGKPLAAVAIALLEERGKLDVHAPIAEVFPEFARHGKERITTLDVLTHRSGISLAHLLGKLEIWGNRDAIRDELVDARLKFPHGTLAYAPWEYGWLICELVHRVDGRELARFFIEEIATPLQLPMLRFGFAGRDPRSVAHSYWLGKPRVVIAGINVAENFERTNNHPLYFESLNPACALVTDAMSLARFYEFVLSGITPSGQRLIAPDTLRKYTQRKVFGFDRSLNAFVAFGRGFAVGTLPPSVFGWWNSVHCFGHGGAFCALGGADYRNGVSFAILTNGNRSIADYTKRFVPLTHLIRGACRRT